MLRSFIIIAATVIAALGGFWLYLHLEPNIAVVTTHPPVAPTTSISTQPNSGSPYGPGANGYVQIIDSKTGRLSERFRADNYDPQANGTWIVTNPHAEFFMSGSQILNVVGTRGVINLPPGSSHDALAGGINAMPNRGTLSNVVIKLYPDASAEQSDAPDLIVTMPAVAFDNDTFRIYTPGDSQTPGDMVPITARGKDYDFDGQGLDLVWNDVDHQLQSLEIVHGKRLTIKHPGAGGMFGASGGPLGDALTPGALLSHSPCTQGEGGGERLLPSPTQSPSAESTLTPTPSLSTWRGRSAPALSSIEIPEYADASNATGAPANANPASDIPPNSPAQPTTNVDSNPKHPVYRAQFFGATPGDVRIEQAGARLVTADLMTCYFLVGPHAQPTTKPASPAQTSSPAPGSQSGAATSVTASSTPLSEPPTGGRDSNPPLPTTNPAEKNVPTTAPTAQKTEAPIDILWTGHLIIVPNDPENPQDTPSPGQATVQFDGDPVTLHDNGSTVTCASAAYRTSDSSGRLLSKINQTPLHIVTDSGATIDAVGANFSRGNLPGAGNAGTGSAAVLHGPGVIHFKDAAAGNAPVKVTFASRCNVDFTNSTQSHSALKTIALSGDVHIDDPALHMQSQWLTLHFATPTTPPPTAAPAQSPAPTGAGDFSRPLSPPSSPSGTASSVAVSPTPAQQLQDVVADGNVLCTIPAEKPLTSVKSRQSPETTGERSISSDHLRLLMAANAGKSYAHELLADGSVHASQIDQDLRCDHLDALLLPPELNVPSGTATSIAVSPSSPAHHHKPHTATDPNPLQTSSGKLQELHARGNVAVTGKNGATATGDLLDIWMTDDQPTIHLTGAAAPATASNGPDILTGPLIKLSPNAGLASVVGPGTMHGLSKSTPKGPARPIEVTWAQGLTLDSNNNVADVAGPVVITARDADGSVDEARSQTMHIILMDKPTTQRGSLPTKGGSTGNASGADAPSGAATSVAASPQTDSSAPTTGGGDFSRPLLAPVHNSAPDAGMNFMHDKQVRSIAMLGSAQSDAQVNSTLTDPAGKPIRQLELKSREIDYDMEQHTLTVPMHGQMFVQDNRPPASPNANGPAANQPAANQPGANPPGPNGATGRGATAFQWEKRFTYSEPDKKAMMLGNVLCVHEDPQSRQAPTRLYCDQLTAFFTQAPPAAPAQANAAQPAPDAADHLQIQSIEAAGNVHLLMPSGDIESTTLDYFPITDVLQLHGSVHRPVNFTDPKGQTSQFDELWLNSKTGDILKMSNFNGGN